MESMAPEGRTKSVNIKRKKITGHSFKARYKKMRRGENVKEFEEPHQVYNVCNKDNKGSTVKTQATCIKGSKEKRVSYNSDKKESCSHNATEDMVLDNSSSCKKFNSRGKGVHSERNSTIKRLQKKCDTRMKKLIQKHQQETKEFHRVWNEKKLEVEKDNRLEAHMIRFIYGETSGSIDRLRILDSSFRKKLEEHNVLKEAQQKDLLKKQLAARSLEKQKADNWLSRCYNEQKVGCGEFSQDLLTDENGGCMNLPASKRVCDELKSVELNKEPIGASEILVHVEPKNLSNPSNKGDAILCPGALMNQRAETDEGLHLTEEILEPIQEASLDLCGSLQMPVREGEIHASLVRDDPEERDAAVPGISGLPNSGANSEPVVEANTVGVLLAEEILEPRQEASSVPEVQIHASLVIDNPEDGDAPVLESARDTNSELADMVVPAQSHVEAQKIKNCEQSRLLSMDASPSANLHPATNVEGQSNDSVLNLFQTAESAEPLVLSDESFQVGVLEMQNNHINVGSASTDGPEDHTHESLASSDLQNTDAFVQEGQGTLQIAVEALEPVELVQLHSELPRMENSEELHPTPTDVSPSINRSPATEVEHQNPELVRNFSPTSQVVEVEDTLQLDESSQIERDLELQSRCMDIGSLNRVAQDSGAHMSNSPLNMAVAQAAVDTEECVNESDPQLGIDAENVHDTLFLEPNNLVNLPCWFANPLGNELNELCKEGEQLKQSFEDVMSRLQSDREKELQETIAQIRRKYEMKLKANEDDFQLKISNLRKNQNKVCLNKLLAINLRATQIDLPPFVQQGMLPSGSYQQLQPSSLPLRFPLQSFAGQPPLPQFIGPTAHTWRHFAFPHPTGHVTSQIISTPVQRFQHTAAAVQSSGNLSLVGRPIHPPYQPVFRPAAAPSPMHPARVHSFSQLIPPSQPSYPPAAVPRPPPPMPPPQPGQVQIPNRLGAMLNDPFLRAPSNYNCAATPLPDISLPFDVLESSYLEALGNVQHSVNSNSAVAS